MNQVPPTPHGTHEPTSARYYRANHGRWSAAFDFSIVRWSAWWASPLGPLMRVGTLLSWLLTRPRGLLRIDTAVEIDGLARDPPVAVHFTWIRLGPLTLMRSIERFALSPDGRTGTISGGQSYFPLLWHEFPYTHSRLEVDADAHSARYHFQVAGFAWEQQVSIDGDARVLVLEAPWLRGVQRLRPR